MRINKKILVFILFASTTFATWTAPVGVPDPNFGITDDVSMYLDPAYKYDYADDDPIGEVVYRTTTRGDPYTHYIDADNGNDGNGPNGTEALPRKTIPNEITGGDYGTFPPGTIIEVHGNLAYNSETGVIGNSKKPIYLRGVEGDEPTFTNPMIFNYEDSKHFIVENIKWDLETYARKTIWFGKYDYTLNYIAIRHCEFYGGDPTPDGSYQVIRMTQFEDTTKLVSNIVIWDCYFHHIGTERTPAKYDAICINADANAQHIWIVDNYGHHIGGDLIHVAYDNYLINYPPYTDPKQNCVVPQYIYIGRNTAHDCYENHTDLKICQYIVVSQNVAYNIGDRSEINDYTYPPCASYRYGMGEGPDDVPKKHIWTIFNIAYHEGNYGGAFLSAVTEGAIKAQDMYFIGNIVYDSHSAIGESGGFLVQETQGAYIINNVVYDADCGGYFLGDQQGGDTDEELVFLNNIVSNIKSDSTYPYCIRFGGTSDSLARATITNNIYYDEGTDTKYRIGIFNPTLSWTAYNTFADFQTAYPAFCTNSSETDPKFVNASGHDFHLASDSPAINAGADVSAYYTAFYNIFGEDITVDYDGDDLTGTAELGPYQYDAVVQKYLMAKEITHETALNVYRELFAARR